MKTTLAQRITQARLAKGLKKTQVAVALKVSTASTTNWENGSVQVIRGNHLLNMAVLFDVSPTWLLTGKGEMNPIGNGFVLPKRQTTAEESPAAYAADENAVVLDRHIGLVPLVSWVNAGEFLMSHDNYQPNDGDEWLPCPVNHGSRTFAVRVTGESMSPDYADGEVIFVDPDCAFKNGDDVVARLPEPDTAMTFKRLTVQPDGAWLVAVNKEWPKRIIEMPVGTQICGVVIGSFRDRRR